MLTRESNQAVFHDADLRDRVQRYLEIREPSAFRELRVAVDRGHVTLTGPVRSFYEKQVALHACQRVAGVIETVDQIQVGQPKPR